MQAVDSIGHIPVSWVFYILFFFGLQFYRYLIFADVSRRAENLERSAALTTAGMTSVVTVYT